MKAVDAQSTGAPLPDIHIPGLANSRRTVSPKSRQRLGLPKTNRQNRTSSNRPARALSRTDTVDALRRVRRWMSRRVFCRFRHARSRVSMVFGPFHYCAFCERAAPDAPETIDDQRRGHRMSLSDNLWRLARERIPTAPAKWLRSYHYYSVYQRFTSNRNKGLRVGSF